MHKFKSYHGAVWPIEDLEAKSYGGVWEKAVHSIDEATDILQNLGQKPMPLTPQQLKIVSDFLHECIKEEKSKGFQLGFSLAKEDSRDLDSYIGYTVEVFWSNNVQEHITCGRLSSMNDDYLYLEDVNQRTTMINRMLVDKIEIIGRFLDGGV